MRVKELRKFIYYNHLPADERLRFLGTSNYLLLKDVPDWMKKHYSATFNNYTLENIHNRYEDYELTLRDFLGLFTEETTSLPFDCIVYNPTYDYEGQPYYLMFSSSLDDSFDKIIAQQSIKNGLAYGNIYAIKEKR